MQSVELLLEVAAGEGRLQLLAQVLRLLGLTYPWCSIGQVSGVLVLTCSLVPFL